MNCFLCKGDMESKVVTHTADLGHCIVIVKNVPAMVCSQCGEIWYNGVIMGQLEKLISTITERVVTEVAIVNYADNVA